ncbi:single-stranded DNA-binding protein [Candidatus Gracilibacteria bacterium]|nr:single-stranded DNA-binding protein [Candidatus Gracilibacteria bacterium]
MDLNKVQIIGRITQDIELRQTPNGQSVTTLSIATNRNWTDGAGQKQEQAEFHNVVLWAKLAEISHQYLAKGKKVYIEGRLQTRSWEAQDGSKRYRTEIVGENMIMLDGNSSGDNGNSNFQAPNKVDTTPGNTTPAVKKSTPKQEEEISVEDLPF